MSLTCLAPRKPKFLLSLLAKLAPTKEPHWHICSEDFTFKEISTHSIKIPTTNSTENRKGSDSNLGSQFSYQFLPTDTKLLFQLGLLQINPKAISTVISFHSFFFFFCLFRATPVTYEVPKPGELNQSCSCWPTPQP